MLGCRGLPPVGVGIAPAAAARAIEGVTSSSAGFVLAAAAAACWEPPLLQAPADPPALKLPVPGSCPGQTTTLHLLTPAESQYSRRKKPILMSLQSAAGQLPSEQQHSLGVVNRFLYYRIMWVSAITRARSVALQGLPTDRHASCFGLTERPIVVQLL